MLGGNIRVENNSDLQETNGLVAEKGSTFYFTIPYYPGQSVKTNDFIVDTDNATDNLIRNLKILIAEDDEVSEKLFTIIVSEIGKEVTKVGTGIEAVETCRNNPDIDLILMDIKMPEMNGYEAARQIRKFDKKVIIIALTAYGLTGDREKALEAGCNDYISKPVNQVLLMKMIKKHFSKVRMI
jgi:CheY-like chemotaxis protein